MTAWSPPSSYRRASLMLLAAGLVSLAAVQLLDGGRARSINVRWAPGVPAEAVRDLERRFALRGQPIEGTTYRYDLLDESPANIRALLAHPSIDDTHHLDRAALTPSADAPVGEAGTGIAWRWGFGPALPYANWLGAIAVLIAALVLTATSRPIRTAAAGIGRPTWAGARAALLAWLAGCVPAVDARAFALFRVAFSLLLGVVLLQNGFDTGLVPREQQRELAIRIPEWVHGFAATEGATAWLQGVLAILLALFAAGVFPRTAYALITGGFTIWFCTVAFTTGTHSLGPLPLVLIALLVVPWHEGAGLMPSRTAGRPSRIPYGYAAWLLTIALAVSFAAAAYAKGPDWVRNGTVRYHFMGEAEIARVDWGLWVAARPGVSVLVSLAVVAGEALIIAAAFSGPSLRLMFFAVAAGLFGGFMLFHDAVWPAWWVLLLGLVPWEWIGQRPTAVGAASRPPLPAVAVALALLFAAQQLVISARGLELPPFFSSYDMYSATFESPEAFERANGGPRFQVIVRTPVGDRDVGDCVRRDRAAIAEMEAALRGDDPTTAALPIAGPVVVRCAAAVAASTTGHVRVLADQRSFDWARGATGYRYKQRLLAEWPVTP